MPPKTGPRRIQKSPKGYVTLEIPSGTYKIKLGAFDEIADADEYLGRSLLEAFFNQPLNFHNVRVAFYFGARQLNDGIRSVKQAGQLLAGANVGTVSKALQEAMQHSGLIAEDDDEPEAEGGEAGED